MYVCLYVCMYACMYIIYTLIFKVVEKASKHNKTMKGHRLLNSRTGSSTESVLQFDSLWVQELRFLLNPRATTAQGLSSVVVNESKKWLQEFYHKHDPAKASKESIDMILQKNSKDLNMGSRWFPLLQHVATDVCAVWAVLVFDG